MNEIIIVKCKKKMYALKQCVIFFNFRLFYIINTVSRTTILTQSLHCFLSVNDWFRACKTKQKRKILLHFTTLIHRGNCTNDLIKNKFEFQLFLKILMISSYITISLFFKNLQSLRHVSDVIICERVVSKKKTITLNLHFLFLHKWI